MAIVFGSPEAREVLLKDFQRRNGHIRAEPLNPRAGGPILPPEHYVAGDWRDAYPAIEDDEGEFVYLDEGSKGRWQQYQR